MLYVTERCVFELQAGGLVLTEIAPGVDLEKDILAHMEVAPKIDELRQMDPRIFREEEMNLRVDLLHLDLPERIALNPDQGHLFLNFEKYRVRSAADIAIVSQAVEAVCAAYGQKVEVLVNYDDFRIEEDLVGDWADMVNALHQKYYTNVTRYAGSAFMRMKLAEAFPDARPHIYESSEQARRYQNKG